MKQCDSRLSTACGTLGLLALLAVLVAWPATPVLAQETPDPEVDATTAGDQPATDATDATVDKQQAEEERVQEYLGKKEQKRARKEAAKLEKEMVRAAERAAAGLPPDDGIERYQLPKEIQRMNEIIRDMEMGKDPSVAGYIDLIELGEASPQQIAAFGSFLSQNGMNRVALSYYDLAVSLEQEDPLLWMNLGTILRQIGELSEAAKAYSEALALAPNNAFAHYNLGAVLDGLGKYEDCLEEYRIALTLDPSLADPAINPQIANNERLLAVKLTLYRENVGTLGLPLVDLPDGGLAVKIEPVE